eukprot:GILK01000495.1.p1 GENE.GILK01000495.1~~GILK01000495.1.p1  ORF type:complete len:427 (+),score=63.74 GILK01000495.1:37-1281(+)
MSTWLSAVFCVSLALVAYGVRATGPEQVHLAWNGRYDQMRVTWVHFDDNAKTLVRYGPVSGQYDSTVEGNQHKMWLPIWKGRVHDATLVNLIPGAEYFYQAGDGTNWSNEFSFKALQPKLPVTFGVYGDFGDVNAQSMLKLQNETANRNFDMILHVGDIAYDMNDHFGAVGDHFMRTLEPVAASVPYMVCPGNHENHWFFLHYTERFSGITGDENMGNSGTNLWYSFNYANMHIVSISTEHSLLPFTKQRRWLDADLAWANQNRDKYPWLIVYGHRPHYCSNRKQIGAALDCAIEAPFLRLILEPILYKAKVDIYFAGHMHSYERLWPVRKGETVQKDYIDVQSPAVVITGSAGCKEKLDHDWKDNDWSAFHASDYGYGRLKVYNDTHLHWEQLSDVTDAVIDEFWMVKTQKRL